MKVAAYVRVSTAKQDANNQKPAIEALGHPVDRWYEETGSAVRTRPVFEQLMRDAEAGKFKTLLCWSLDRLGRSMLGNVTAWQRLRAAGVRVISVREPWLGMGGPTEELLVAVFGWVAAQEREQIGERTRMGQDRARKQGTKSGLPFGRPRKRGPLDEAEAAVRGGMAVRTAARTYSVPVSSLQRRLAPRPQNVIAKPAPGTA